MWYLGAVAPDANETCACMRPAQRYSVWSPTNKVAWACAARGGHASDMESHIRPCLVGTSANSAGEEFDSPVGPNLDQMPTKASPSLRGMPGA